MPRIINQIGGDPICSLVRVTPAASGGFFPVFIRAAGVCLALLLFLSSVAAQDAKPLPSLSADAIITIPPGVYTVDAPVRLRSGQWFDGRGVILRPAENFTGSAIVEIIGEPKRRATWTTVEGLRIDCLGRPVVGIRSEWTSRLELRCVRVDDSQVQAAILRDGWDTRIDGCVFMRAGSRRSDRNVPCLELSAAGRGKREGTRTIWIESTTIEDYCGVGVLAVNQFSVLGVANKIHHRHVGPNSGAAQYADSEMGLLVESCERVRWDSGLFVGFAGRHFQIRNSTDATVTNGTFTGKSESGE